MGIVLKSHNIEAYEKVVKGFENKKKIAVVEPPGTGKSFIALKWIEENQDKKTLLLVPSYSIILQYEEHLKISGYELSDFSNLQIMPYSTLMAEVKDGVVPNEVNHIVLDEFHRCGAPEWGKGVKAVLEKNRNAKILGLSATPIRYLDHNRNMSDELFDGNVVYEMDLTEAVARGILHFPLYITGIYKLDEDIKRYEKKIEGLASGTLKETLNKKLELAKRRLEKATKLEDLFSNYMKKKDGKIILFCKDKKHMSEMIDEANKWFSKVNPEIDIYSVYYGKKNNEESLRKFYNSNNSHLKLLYCIDMLNEGFHVPKIDGIVMLRPTISPNLFIQQLGRGLSLENEDVTIYDIVNNVRSSKDIKDFIENVKKKREQLIKKNKIKANEPFESFEILEEVREVFDTLNDIEDMLQSFTSKEYKICLIEEFYREKERLPKFTETYKGVALGIFLNSIKQGHTNIAEEHMKRLRTLGFNLEAKEEKKERKIKLIEEFYKENGRLPNLRETYKEIAIGQFLNSIKQGKTSITEEQLQRLVILGFDINAKDKEEEKENKIKLVEDFFVKNGRLPKATEKYQGMAIGYFVHKVKSRRIKVTEEQMNRLCTLGLNFESKDDRRKRQFELLEEFHKKNGRLPKATEKYQGEALGTFLTNVKIGKIKLVEEQMNWLFTIGFNIETKNFEKERKIKLLEEFYREFGRLPKFLETYKDTALGTFLHSIKQGKTSITEEQMMRLKKIGFQGQINDMRVERSIQKIEQFYEKMGRIPMPNENLGKKKVGEMLVQIRIGQVRITESQFLRLQQMDATLTREQVSFFEKPKTYIKK